jgi:hypothetical protein
MTVPKKYSLLVFLSIVAVILSACGPKPADTLIATYVAMTVEAEHTQDAQSTPTATPRVALTLPSLSTLTPAVTQAPPTAPAQGGGTYNPCYSASFVSDVSIPDGTIVAPGASFMKTWRVKNDGSCPWNSTFKFVFMNGDIMGGAYVYDFPGVAAPGQTVDIPIQLYAPAANGTYTGNWKIQAPDKTIFGVGEYSVPLSVKVVVGSGTPENNRTETAYSITNVTYDVSRECTSANTFYTISAHITSNGPITATYSWIQSDGNNDPRNTITFASANTRTVTREWSQHIGSASNERWAQIVVTDPVYQEFPRVSLPALCW